MKKRVHDSQRRRMCALVVIGAALALSATAAATIVIKFDVDGLTTTSDAIAIGRVESRSSHWEGQRIVTEVSVRIAVPVSGKAEAGEQVTVRVLGGRVGDLAQHVAGTAAFVPGEDVLLFLERPSSSQARVVGLSQGKFKIVDGPGNKLWAVRDLQGLSLAEVALGDQGQRVAQVSEGLDAMAAVPLDELLQDVVEGLEKIEEPVRSDVFEKLGPDLSRTGALREAIEALEGAPLRREAP
jgi:hypothetical protein